MEMQLQMDHDSKKKKRRTMPIGYRFRPTDEELIIHYLRPKAFSFPLPAPAILHSHHHLFLHHPSRLPGDSKEKRYFFCKTPYINRSDNTLHNPAGYWKPIVNKLILAPGCNHPIGLKKSFVFYQFSNHRRSASRTPWILHEFSLLPSPLLYPLLFKMDRVGMEEWVVCSIHMKSRKAKNQHQGAAKKHKKSHSNHQIHNEEESTRPLVIDEDSMDDINGFGSPQPAAASTSSSGITCNDEEEEESTSINN